MSICLEICVESLDGARAAQESGAHRIELCSSLAEGGLTPSAGLLAQVRKHIQLPIHVMARPRRGDFLYSSTEIETLIADIQHAKNHGADGIVFGALQANGTIHQNQTKRIIEATHPLPITFHRAIDLTRDLLEALDTLITLGINRVLTSGGASTVEQGLDTLKQLTQKANDRIIIMPGSGVTENNIQHILYTTGAEEIHASARSQVDSAMQYHAPNITMSADTSSAEQTRHITNPNRIRAMILAIQNYQKESQ